MFNNMTTKERLVVFLKYLSMGQNAFEAQIGISNGYISNLKGSIGSEVLSKIKKVYPELSIDWLIDGEGEMIRPNVHQTNNYGDNINAGDNLSLDKSVNTNIDPKYVEKLEEDNKKMIHEISKLKDDLLKSQQTIIDLLTKN